MTALALGLATAVVDAGELRGHGGPVRALIVAPDGGVLIGGADGGLRLFCPDSDAPSEISTRREP